MNRGEHGLMLPEVLCAAALIGIGIAGLMSVVPISGYGIREGDQLSAATFLAEQRLEQVRNAPWTRTPANDCLGLGAADAPSVPVGTLCTMGSATLASGATTFVDEESASGYAGFRRTVRIRDCATIPCAGVSSPDLRLVTVNVSYAATSGVGSSTGTKSTTLTMTVAQR